MPTARSTHSLPPGTLTEAFIWTSAGMTAGIWRARRSRDSSSKRRRPASRDRSRRRTCSPRCSCAPLHKKPLLKTVRVTTWALTFPGHLGFGEWREAGRAIYRLVRA